MSKFRHAAMVLYLAHLSPAPSVLTLASSPRPVAPDIEILGMGMGSGATRARGELRESEGGILVALASAYFAVRVKLTILVLL